ncbi:MAG: Gldg family protein [Kiritimatiellae bacterium]|nr:Gldg family protein [Kiritimatiellia bacterium]
MSPVRVTFMRTVGVARGLFSTVFVIGGFLAVAALSFAYGLETAEGGRLPLPVVWASRVAPLLPALAALLAMDVWSDERMTGRVDALLSAAVRERDYVLGKFLGVWAMTMLAVAGFMVTSVASVWLCAPKALAGSDVCSFLLALLALALQTGAWCAVSVAMSALFSRPAAAACASIVVLVVLPRGLWEGVMILSEAGRRTVGTMPIDAHVIDFASGIVPVGSAAAYVAVAAVMLFVATKFVASYRFVGRGAFGLKVSTGVSVALSLVLCALTLLFLRKVNPVVDLTAAGASAALSPRTRSILADSGGGISITSFMPRNDPGFDSTARLLRMFRRESASVGGAGMQIRFVDPRWDIGAAERLVQNGAVENSVVFEKGRRMVSVPVDDDFGERACASAVRRITFPPQRRNVYWTVGHGEIGYDVYGPFGMSDIARDLAREGFLNHPIDLAASRSIPRDCALIVIAGAKDDFSRAEIGRVDSHLREGGRLLVLMSSTKTGGVVSMLPSWGIRPVDAPIMEAKTLTGTDVIVSDFTDHAISAPLKGSRIVLDRPVTFVPSAVAETGGSGADNIGFSAVAVVGPAAVAAAVERGVGGGGDLAVRPTRIVAVGDASFAMNGQLAARASANRDFFLNCAAYLSGADAHAFGGEGFDTLETGLDRAGRLRHLAWTAAFVPAAAVLLLALPVVRRRRRA